MDAARAVNSANRLRNRVIECANWIQHTLKQHNDTSKFDIGTGSEEQQTETFFQLLETGEILCKLLNCIKPGVVRVRLGAQPKSFLARDNIMNFISVCNKQFQIPLVILFECDDLVLRKNVKNVISTLVRLALVAKQMKPDTTTTITNDRLDNGNAGDKLPIKEPVADRHDTESKPSHGRKLSVRESVKTKNKENENTNNNTTRPSNQRSKSVIAMFEEKARTHVNHWEKDGVKPNKGKTNGTKGKMSLDDNTPTKARTLVERFESLNTQPLTSEFKAIITPKESSTVTTPKTDNSVPTPTTTTPKTNVPTCNQVPTPKQLVDSTPCDMSPVQEENEPTSGDVNETTFPNFIEESTIEQISN